MFFIELFKWWPWYVDAINFDDLENLPTLVTIDEFICENDDHPSIVGNRVNVVYLSNTTTTLTSSNSPYYVTSDVLIQYNAVLNIEDSVEIIFAGNYEIAVRGTINGCYNVDTSNTQKKFFPEMGAHNHE